MFIRLTGLSLAERGLRHPEKIRNGRVHLIPNLDRRWDHGGPRWIPGTLGVPTRPARLPVALRLPPKGRRVMDNQSRVARRPAGGRGRRAPSGRCTTGLAVAPEALELRALLSTYTVTTTADSNTLSDYVGTLRWA